MSKQKPQDKSRLAGSDTSYDEFGHPIFIYGLNGEPEMSVYCGENSNTWFSLQRRRDATCAKLEISISNNEDSSYETEINISIPLDPAHLCLLADMLMLAVDDFLSDEEKSQ